MAQRFRITSIILSILHLLLTTVSGSRAPLSPNGGQPAGGQVRCSKAVKADYDNGGHEIFRVGAAWHDTDPNDRRSVDGYAIEYAYTTSWKIYITNTTSLFLNVDPLKMCSETPSVVNHERVSCEDYITACGKEHFEPPPPPLRLMGARYEPNPMEALRYIYKELESRADTEYITKYKTDFEWITGIHMYGTKQLKQPGPLRYVKLRWDYDKMKCVPFQLSAGATSEALPLLEKDKQWEYIDELKKLVDATEAVDSALPLEERCRLQLIRYGDEIYKQYTEKARTKRVRWEGLDNDEDKAEAAAALLQLLAYGWQ